MLIPRKDIGHFYFLSLSLNKWHGSHNQLKGVGRYDPILCPKGGISEVLLYSTNDLQILWLIGYEIKKNKEEPSISGHDRVTDTGFDFPPPTNIKL